MGGKRSKKNRDARKSRPAFDPWIPGIAAGFILSRIIFFSMGVRFDAWSEIHPMQFVFPELLKTDFFRSLFYLHSQPPLFNLFIGVIQKIFPVQSDSVYAAVYISGGLLLAITMYATMKRLGVSGTVSGLATLVFIVSPEAVLFENILFYTYPVTILLCLSTWFLFRYIDREKPRDGFMFFSLLAAIILTRSLFHVIWFLAVLGIVMVFRRRQYRQLIAVSIIPLMVVLFMYGKNLVLFGTFSTSTWLGGSFAKMTTSMTSEEDRLALAREGVISELAFIPPIQGLWVYHEKARVPVFRKTGIPVLDLEYIQSVGNNYNNLSFISILNQYKKDAVAILKRHPRAYLKGISKAVTIYFFSAGDWFISNSSAVNLPKLAFIEELYNRILFGRFFPRDKDQPGSIVTYSRHVDQPRHVGFFIPVYYLLAIGYGFMLTARSWLEKKTATPAAITVSFLLFTIIYVSLVSNAFEVLENERFRFLTEPSVVILLGLLVIDVKERVTGKT